MRSYKSDPPDLKIEIDPDDQAVFIPLDLEYKSISSDHSGMWKLL
jgi:hypothetical protein